MTARVLQASGLTVLGCGVLGAALGGCAGGGPTPMSAAVLRNADIPPSLGLVESHSATATSLGKAFSQTYPGCRGHVAVFTRDGKPPTPVSVGTTIFPEVFSESSSCPSAAEAENAFQHAAAQVEAQAVGGTAVSGIGSSAVVATMNTARADEEAIFWKNGTVLGFIQLSGPTADHAISMDQIKLLARRQIARSSG